MKTKSKTIKRVSAKSRLLETVGHSELAAFYLKETFQELDKIDPKFKQKELRHAIAMVGHAIHKINAQVKEGLK